MSQGRNNVEHDPTNESPPAFAQAREEAANAKSDEDLAAVKELLGKSKENPNALITFLEKNPGALAPLDYRWIGEGWRVKEVFSRKEARDAKLQAILKQRDDLPAWVMAQTGDVRYLPVLSQRIKSESNGWQKRYLEACARALGEPPDKIVKVSTELKQPPFEFDYHRLRQPTPQDFGCRFDSEMTWITGRIVLNDGSVAIDPQACLWTKKQDKWEQGEYESFPSWNPVTGRFFESFNLRAPFATVERAAHKGADLTEPLWIAIKSRDGKPLNVRIDYDTPDLEMILTMRADSKRFEQ